MAAEKNRPAPNKGSFSLSLMAETTISSSIGENGIPPIAQKQQLRKSPYFCSPNLWAQQTDGY